MKKNYVMLFEDFKESHLNEADEVKTPSSGLKTEGEMLILNPSLKLEGVATSAEGGWSPFDRDSKGKLIQPKGVEWSGKNRNAVAAINNAVVKFKPASSQLGVGTSYSSTWQTKYSGTNVTNKNNIFSYINIAKLKPSYSIEELNTAKTELVKLTNYLMKLYKTSMAEYYYDIVSERSGGYSTGTAEVTSYSKDNIDAAEKASADPKNVKLINEKIVKPLNTCLSSLKSITSKLGIDSLAYGGQVHSSYVMGNARYSETSGDPLVVLNKVTEVSPQQKVDDNSAHAAGSVIFSFAWSATALVQYLITLNSSESEYIKYLTAISQSKAGKPAAKKIALAAKKENPKLKNMDTAFLESESFDYNDFLNEAKGSCKSKVCKFLKENGCECDYEAGTCKVDGKSMKIEKALLKLNAPKTLITSYTDECSAEVSEALRVRRF